MSRIREYSIAGAIIVGGVLARSLLDLVIPSRLPFITFFPAVALVAYLTSRNTTLLALVGCTLAGVFWVEPPAGEGDWTYSVIGGAVFLFTAGMIVYLVEELKRARLLSQAHEQELQLITHELSHRISNLFAVATAICQQTIRQGVTGKQLEKVIGDRLRALATGQKMVDVMSLKGAELRALALNILQPLAPKPDKLMLQGPAVHLPTEATTPFALVLHELATNAIKHGAWSANGHVNLSWQMRDGALVVTWQELGGPSVTPPDRNGLGASLIRSAIPRAKIDYELPPHGVECRISLEYPPPRQ